MTEEIKTKSVLVVFGQDLPKKKKSWWQQFDEVIGPKELAIFTSPGSIQQAFELINKVSGFTLANGSRLSKLMNLQGYELWWIHYDDIYYKFCLPYTQYRNLLLHLKDFDKIYLYQAPWPYLFQYFLRAHNRQCIILSKFRLRNLLPMPLGIFIQIILSGLFLPWLKIAKPGLMVWTSDKFDPPRDFDFRYRLIYEELREKKIPFVEFIRSLESWPVVLQHAWRRKRPVFYSAAVIEFINYFTNRFSRYSPSFSSSDPKERFWFQVSAHYLRNIRGTIWSIRLIKFILQWIGIKAAIIAVGTGRTFHDLLGCKLAGIKTVGIQHGATIRYFCVYDFMPGFDGQKKLSVDKYGLWSEWWKEYYITHSRAYGPEQLYVSGHMRPLKKEKKEPFPPELKKERPRVLLISEQLAVPQDIMPYFSALLEIKEFDFYLKFRPYRDGFEEWLKKHHPDILKRVKTVRGTMQEAAALADIVVGSHSTAVLEALLQLKPFVLFRTQKWGDYFDIKNFQTQSCFFAENPEQLLDCIKNSLNTSKEELRQLQERFFGNPYQDGSKWVVEQAEKYLNSSGQEQGES